jgi:hypothetical protein
VFADQPLSCSWPQAPLALALCFGLKSWLLLSPSLLVLAWLLQLPMDLSLPLPLNEVELDVAKPTSTELDSF